MDRTCCKPRGVMRAHPLLIPAVVLAAVLSGTFLHRTAQADLPLPVTGPAPAARDWNPRRTPVVEVVRAVKDAVVNIHSERTVRAPAEELFSLTPSQSRVNGMGTGIVIDPRGYLITNQHVVEDVSSLRVRLADGNTLGARVLARDTEFDLALLKINPPRPLPVMPLGTARDLQVGETVVAIGNAYGYDHTVTVGVVSAIGRDVTLNREVRYRSLIQTDASINPGNSGGPLINMHGELVGVNVAIRAGAQGIGFAIPVDNMIRVASAMLAQVRSRGNVGPVGMVVVDEISSGVETRKVVVDRVEDGPAGKSGLLRGDVLVKVGEQPIGSSLDVQRGLIDKEGGQRLKVVVNRNGIEHKVELVLDGASGLSGGGRLDSRPPATLAAGAASPAALIWRSLGLRLTPLLNTVEVTRSHPQLHGGLVVQEVQANSAAARAGFRPNDVLVGLHQWEMLTLENVRFVLEHPDRATFSPIRFYVLRAGQIHRGVLQPSE
jgi:serine protease Do